MGFIRDLASVLTFGIIDNTKEANERKNRKTPAEEFMEKYEKEQEKRRIEEQKRTSIPLRFVNPITREKFNELAIKAGKSISRLWIETEDHYVYGTVKSSSGISEWYFKLDYNDYGRITGKCYKVRMDNYDSNIPNVFIEKFGLLLEEELKGCCCPQCGSYLYDQSGFDPNNNYNVCRKCGTMVFNPNLYDGERFPGVIWFCDECNDLLSAQPGFRDIFSKWKCQKCGYINRIESDNFEHEITMEFSKVRLSWKNGDVSKKVNEERIDKNISKSVSWNEIELKIDYLFKHFDEIYYEGEHRAQNNRPGDTVVINDLIIELRPNNKESPSVGFAPYEGCYFESKNEWRVLKHEYLTPNCIKQIFKNFYDRKELINREWWD